MKPLHRFVQFTLLLLITLLIFPRPIFAQSEVTCEADVVVQADDWLSKIAAKFYNDPLAFSAIAEVTNAKAASDNSYATIENVDVIEPGWKLCIPGPLVEAETETIPEESVSAEPAAAGLVPITLVQMNDVYEMSPVSGGAEGGLARVATLRKQLLAENPNTFTFLAGDLFSPSALGTASIDGERLAGKQMVAAMNQLGLDFMTFGNHEFDVNEQQFYSRLAESNFTWFSSNVFDAAGQPIAGVAPNHTFDITGPDGQTVTVGLFGLTLGSNPKPYISYTDPFTAAGEQVAALRDQVDILIALTHLPVAEDTKLAQQFPQIDLILGGHEHEHMDVIPGEGLAPIYKADANARTVYVHNLLFDPASGALQINAELQPITPLLADDADTQAVIDQWTQLAFDGFRASGFNPEQNVAQSTIPLDGLESSVRNGPTDLTNIIGQGMLHNVPDAELSIYNGGSIRIDDIIPPGNITEYDVIRVLPFGGNVMAVSMSGSLLRQVLEQGQANAGTGGYLQTSGVTVDADGNWRINDVPLAEAQTYKVAINDFLLTGNEQGLAYLTPDNEGLTILQEYDDIRQTTIDELTQTFPQN